MTGFVPARLAVFKLAFSHKSSNAGAREHTQTNNERLEYLGDAVLGTIVADYLFRKYPNADEGFLTKMRSKIVKRKTLNAIGESMELDVLLSEYNNMRLSSSMLGNAVEALVGAVYLEKGYRSTERFVIERILKRYVDVHELENVDDNYKSRLLEHCQKKGQTIAYKLVEKTKQDRRDRFKVAVLIDGKSVATADDFNKKSAEQLASLRALEKLGVIKREKTAKSPTGKSRSPKSTKSRTDDSRSTSRRSSTTKTTDTARKSTSTTRSSSRTPNARPTTSRSARADKAKQANVEQANLTPTAKAENAVPAAPANQKKETPAKPAATKPKGSGAVLPRRKQRRNNTVLGRAVWNAVSTFATVDQVTDGIQQNIDQKGWPAAHVPDQPSLIFDEKANLATQTVAIIEHEEKTDPQPVVNKPVEQKAVTPPPAQQIQKAKRKQRPVPLYILNPIIADAVAVLNLSTPSKKSVRKKRKVRNEPIQPILQDPTERKTQDESSGRSKKNYTVKKFPSKSQRTSRKRPAKATDAADATVPTNTRAATRRSRPKRRKPAPKQQASPTKTDSPTPSDD